MDNISIKGLRVFAYHGVNPEEKEKGQPFVLNITLSADLSCAGQSDCLTDTVNYAQVAKTAIAAMQTEKNDLIERAATRVADAIGRTFGSAPVPRLEAVTVELQKPRAPIAADFDCVSVTVTRTREQWS